MKHLINRFVTWLRRDDQELEWLRQDVQKKEKEMDWENLQKAIIYLLIGSATIGFGVMAAMWISL